MTTKEIIKAFINQAVFFNTGDKVTKALGIGTWIVLAFIFSMFYLMFKYLTS